MEKKSFLSYAEDFEDLILYNVLNDVKEGHYIDVGANHPWKISVTKSLYLRGWRGINIEPLKKEYSLLCEDRPLDINLNIGISNKSGKLLLSDSGVLSSFNKEEIKKQKVTGTSKSELFAKVETLKDVCKKNIKPNEDIHFCKIDVESYEKEVLEGMDFKNYRPWIIVIESLTLKFGQPSHIIWEHILLENGYSLAYTYGLNRYYVSDEKNNLKDRFISMKELQNKYDVHVIMSCKKRPYQIGMLAVKYVLDPIYLVYTKLRLLLMSFVYKIKHIID